MTSFRWRAVLAAVGLVALTHLAAVPAAAADGVVSGTILTDNGVALPNACAEAYTAAEHNWVAESCADGSGNYAIILPPDTYVSGSSTTTAERSRATLVAQRSRTPHP